jgi:putative FmdB family regulatory protein
MSGFIYIIILEYSKYIIHRLLLFLKKGKKMPIYNYNCEDCNKDSEVLVKSCDDKAECTSCGSKNVKRVYSSFDFSMKSSTAPACGSGGCPGGSCGL